MAARFTLRLFGCEILNIEIREPFVPMEEIESALETELDDDEETENLPYGFAPPVAA